VQNLLSYHKSKILLYRFIRDCQKNHTYC